MSRFVSNDSVVMVVATATLGLGSMFGDIIGQSSISKIVLKFKNTYILRRRETDGVFWLAAVSAMATEVIDQFKIQSLRMI
uniref:Uncharacterized protein n=1 Tax=Oryza glumipatula TaxID=40148 RepID=A0A0E0AX92_9ORYZ